MNVLKTCSIFVSAAIAELGGTLSAMLWGWALDRERPDLFDGLGPLIVLAGVVVVLWGRRLFR